MHCLQSFAYFSFLCALRLLRLLAYPDHFVLELCFLALEARDRVLRVMKLVFQLRDLCVELGDALLGAGDAPLSLRH